MTTFRLVDLPWPCSTIAFVLSIVMVIIAVYYLVYKNKMIYINYKTYKKIIHRLKKKNISLFIIK